MFGAQAERQLRGAREPRLARPAHVQVMPQSKIAFAHQPCRRSIQNWGVVAIARSPYCETAQYWPVCHRARP